MIISCMPTVFIAGAAAGGAVLYDQRDQGTILNDLQLTSKAKKAFINAPEFKKQSSLHFHSYNQNLLITGQVSNIELLNRIDEIGQNITQAKTVYNQAHVTGRKIQPSSTKDTWITTKVKTMLLAEKGLRSNDFKVVTENNVVYLMGLTSKSKADLAARITSQVDGVTKVVKLIELTA